MKLGVMDIFNDLKKQTKTMTAFHLHLTLEAASHNLIWPSIIGISKLFILIPLLTIFPL